mmetsp:Transcript_36835/g.74796  ORF Transcript_36835/g.74796 Transcript_36835/m.74796 type:complete len:354 (+) Transcript_36835:76-1137(+)
MSPHSANTYLRRPSCVVAPLCCRLSPNAHQPSSRIAGTRCCCHRSAASALPNPTLETPCLSKVPKLRFWGCGVQKELQCLLGSLTVVAVMAGSTPPYFSRALFAAALAAAGNSARLARVHCESQVFNGGVLNFAQHLHPATPGPASSSSSMDVTLCTAVVFITQSCLRRRGQWYSKPGASSVSLKRPAPRLVRHWHRSQHRLQERTFHCHSPLEAVEFKARLTIMPSVIMSHDQGIILVGIGIVLFITSSCSVCAIFIIAILLVHGLKQREQTLPGLDSLAPHTRALSNRTVATTSTVSTFTFLVKLLCTFFVLVFFGRSRCTRTRSHGGVHRLCAEGMAAISIASRNSCCIP